MNEQTTGQVKPNHSHINTVMSWGTIVFLIAVFAGGLVDFFYPRNITNDSGTESIGLALIVLATVIIFWATNSARKLVKDIAVNVSVDVFKTGSYRYSRNPTYLGLTLLVLGFGFISNSLSIIISAIVAFVIVHFTFLKKEEESLETKFGEVYRQYKKEVRRWF